MCFRMTLGGGRGRRAVVALAVAVGMVGVAEFGAGCGDKKKPTTRPAVVRYPTLPPKKGLPEYMKGTIFEVADLQNTEPMVVGGFGLVVDLQPGTGDGVHLPTPVRNYMVNEMAKRGFGRTEYGDEWGKLPPERILTLPQKTVTVVEVLAMLPPGVREGQQVDVQVNALPNNDTSNLARGRLFRTDLRQGGNNPVNPAGAVNVFARAQGPIFVNPALALSTTDAGPTARASRRTGKIMDGAMSLVNRPLALRLRTPSWSYTQAVGRRIVEHFNPVTQSDTVAAEAFNEAIVNLVVPNYYKGDWEHFAGVATHLYMSAGPGVAAMRAKKLAEEAVKPDAFLEDISYCWEGLGSEALPAIRPLMTHENPRVAFAAARAAAFLQDPGAPAVLVRIAKTPSHPFQVEAVQVLGALPASPMVNSRLRELLDTDLAQVRQAAYLVLVANKDPVIWSRNMNEKFILDVVTCGGPPMIFATRQGTPRLAILGGRPGPALTLPLTFTTMNGQLMLASAMEDRAVMVYYRGADAPVDPKTRVAAPVRLFSRPDVAELVGVLAGIAETEDGRRLDFSYGDVVAILQTLTDRKSIAAPRPDGTRVATAFVLQEVGGSLGELSDAPLLPGELKGRPQGEPAAATQPAAGAVPAGDAGAEPTAAVVK